MTAGGKRKGAGRPFLKNKKVQYSTRLAPELILQIKKHAKPAAQIICEALTEWFAKRNQMRGDHDKNT
jgi:hypothetical protein